jgi:hypothetical protein
MFQVRKWERFKFVIDYEARQVRHSESMKMDHAILL